MKKKVVSKTKAKKKPQAKWRIKTYKETELDGTSYLWGKQMMYLQGLPISLADMRYLKQQGGRRKDWHPEYAGESANWYVYYKMITNKPLPPRFKLAKKTGRKTVKLNNNYTAIVLPEKRTVIVGCQKIPFTTISELYLATKKK